MLPPSSGEAISVPIYAAQAWLADITAPVVADVEGTVGSLSGIWIIRRLGNVRCFGEALTIATLLRPKTSVRATRLSCLVLMAAPTLSDGTEIPRLCNRYRRTSLVWSARVTSAADTSDGADTAWVSGATTKCRICAVQAHR